MKLLMTSFLIFSLIGCSSGPARPNSFVWGMSGPSMWLEGYNILTDYDADGILKPDAVKKYHPFASVKDLNAAIVILPPGKHEGDEGSKGVKRWLSEMRLWAKDHCK